MITLGIIGAGEIATKAHLPVLSVFADLRVEFVADLRKDAAIAAARSYRTAAIEITDDPSKLPFTDIGLLAVPVGKRLPYYELFAKRGTAVFAEKPLAISHEEAQRICCLYPDHRLACGFQRRVYSGIQVARAAVEGNWFGPIRKIDISEGALTTKTGTDARFYDDYAAAGGGILMDLGCHSLDSALYISQADDVRIISQGMFFDGDIDREFHAVMQLSGPKGRCDMECSVSWVNQARNTMDVHFDTCILSAANRPEKLPVLRDSKGNAVATLSPVGQHHALTLYQAFYLEWKAFLHGLRTGTTSEFAGRTSLPTVRLVEMLYQEARAAR